MVFRQKKIRHKTKNLGIYLFDGSQSLETTHKIEIESSS